MTYQEKLSAIRESMLNQGIDAYIIPSSDPHMSEYVPDRYKCVHFASGFTGSAGTLVITHDFAGLWADFRYFVQAEQQLSHSGYELVKLKVQHTPEYIGWLIEKLQKGACVAFDYKLMSMALGEDIKHSFSACNVSLLDADLLEGIWENRPPLPADVAVLLPEKDCGQSFGEKLSALRLAMQRVKADLHVISSLDDLAWLFNIRGKDVSYNPVLLCYALITSQQVILYINEGKFSSEDMKILSARNITLKSYTEITREIESLHDSSILLDPKRTCYQFFTLLSADMQVNRETSPLVSLKSIKNSTEIENTRAAMVSDGVALTRFFKWLEEHIGHTKITELSAAKKVKEFREMGEDFAGISFASIAGYGPHAALPHYSPDETTDLELLPKGLFLLDSGGHYFYGTTDITRTVPLGETTQEEKTDYTLVLSALIFGSAARFPAGTRGYQIDGICRQQLWQMGINYGHGTGHGVGYYLNVHEGPQNIGPANAAVSIDPGMITSIEPGIYRPEKHGVRIENLVLTVEAESSYFGEFYKFETITLAHIDTSILLTELLLPEQIKWINDYNNLVYEKLSPHLSEEESQWLGSKCKPLAIAAQ